MDGVLKASLWNLFLSSLVWYIPYERREAFFLSFYIVAGIILFKGFIFNRDNQNYSHCLLQIFLVIVMLHCCMALQKMYLLTFFSIVTIGEVFTIFIFIVGYLDFTVKLPERLRYRAQEAGCPGH